MLPEPLQAQLERMTEGIGLRQLKQEAEALSLRYRGPRVPGRHLLTGDSEALSYALTRMPATYGAVSQALAQSLMCTDLRPATLLDVGAGTGAASWACDRQLELQRVTCLQREPAMRRLGSALMQAGSDVLRDAQWHEADLTRGLQGHSASLVTAAYVLNELTQEELPAAVDRLWDAAEDMLLILQPGTPQGWQLGQRIRALLTARGAHLIAPCVYPDGCPVAQGDWCHFVSRIQRSRLHRMLKDGDAPYEDEKFIYLAFTRQPGGIPPQGRVLRHPQVNKGRIGLTLCTREGLQERTVTKNEGAPYRLARKLQVGDAFDPQGSESEIEQ